MPDETTMVTQTLQAYPSRYLTVVDGYNLGAEISFLAELTLDDIYSISVSAVPNEFTVIHKANRQFEIVSGSSSGTPGNLLHFDCMITLMSTLGDVVDVIIMVETSNNNRVENVLFLPLVNLIPGRGYTLIGINQDDPQARYGEHAMAAFAQGTHITISSGEQRPIENLKPGDEILTRSDGPQVLHWVRKSTVRAIGDFAAVRIRAGVLKNSRDLVVSPDHRLFIYQKTDDLGIGRREVFVEARHLVDETTIIWERGGFIDYYQLLFENHQIIYAEGIAAETLRVTPRNRHSLPAEICEKAAIPPEGHARRDYDEYELNTDMLSSFDVLKLLHKNPFQ